MSSVFCALSAAARYRSKVETVTPVVASCEIGNKLTELEQWNKLKLVKEIAETVWGD